MNHADGKGNLPLHEAGGAGGPLGSSSGRVSPNQRGTYGVCVCVCVFSFSKRSSTDVYLAELGPWQSSACVTRGVPRSFRHVERMDALHGFSVFPLLLAGGIP